MKKLVIENFSCIKKASIDFSKITIFIGPQASGKSIICKLAYFFTDVVQIQKQSIIKNENLEDFKFNLKKKFTEWFPVSAWGSKQFSLTFSDGNFSITLTRKIYKKKIQEDFRIKFSEDFEEQFLNLLSETDLLRKKITHKNFHANMEFDWKVSESSQISFKKLLDKNSYVDQFFIPAGRSFFTSLGKAITAFEQGNILDPLILRFGRFYTTAKKEYQYFEYRLSNNSKILLDKINNIFGGQLKFEGEKDYVLTSDGRQIPFSALSSGQQELLPLLIVIPQFLYFLENQALFIEEPEAHLFPIAQGAIVEVLAGITNVPKSGLKLILTTHSPYVLTKFNNLIKAGQLSRKRCTEEKKEKLNRIINSQFWLNSKNIRAYAIKDGITTNLIEEDGFINADYLDDVSNDLCEEFSSLQDWEFSDV